MAKRTATATKRAKTPTGRGTRKKAARPGNATHVSFGIHGLTHIVHAVKTAGLEKEFNEVVGNEGKFVNVSRKGMQNIHSFVQKYASLTGLATEMQECDCPPNDPYCRYFGPQT